MSEEKRSIQTVEQTYHFCDTKLTLMEFVKMETTHKLVIDIRNSKESNYEVEKCIKSGVKLYNCIKDIIDCKKSMSEVDANNIFDIVDRIEATVYFKKGKN